MRGGTWLRRRVGATLRIARWELGKNAGGVDRRAVLIAAVALVGVVGVAGLAAFGPLALGQGVAIDEGIYRVGVEPSSPYYDVVSSDPTFAVREPDRGAVAAGRQEVLIVGDRVVDYADTAKGRAAIGELREAVERYNDWRMTFESNRTAAFPVLAEVSYVERNVTTDLSNPEGGRVLAEQEVGGDTTTGDGRATPDGSETDRSDTDTPTDGTTDPGGDTGETNGSGFGSGLTARLTGQGVSGTPSDISPPFPFASLILAFVFVLPMNFVSQAYGSTMLDERIDRRGELLLVAPIEPVDVVAGKTLPYALGALALAAVLAAGLGGSVVSVLAMVPIALLFLSTTFLGAMFARSFKELTFVTVTVTISLTTYAFVPAIFTDVTPVALISPLTLIVRDLQGTAIGLGQFAFSTGPPTATALVVFWLGLGLYREEDLFAQRPIPLKVLDALGGPVYRPASAAKLSALLLPFVLVTELVAVAGLFALGELSIPLVLVAVAVIEELAKSLPAYAGYVQGTFRRRLRTALAVGTASGVGFFLAEKATLVVQLAGLTQLSIGRATFQSGALSDPTLSGYLLAPIALHVVTACLSSVGASRGRRAYAVGLSAAILVHLGYNLAVVIAYA